MINPRDYGLLGYYTAYTLIYQGVISAFYHGLDAPEVVLDRNGCV